MIRVQHALSAARNASSCIAEFSTAGASVVETSFEAHPNLATGRARCDFQR
jgi:hypothetical protein